MHAIAGRRNLQNIFRFRAARMRLPEIITPLPISILAALGLGMRGIFQRVSAIRNAYVINVAGKPLALAEVQNTLVRAAPIVAEVRFVLVVPDQPSAAREVSRCWQFQVSENLGEASDIERSRRPEHARRLLDPDERPLNVRLLRFKGIPLGLFDVIWWVGKYQVNGIRRQRSQPGGGVAKPESTMWMPVH